MASCTIRYRRGKKAHKRACMDNWIFYHALQEIDPFGATSGTALPFVKGKGPGSTFLPVLPLPYPLLIFSPSFSSPSSSYASLRLSLPFLLPLLLLFPLLPLLFFLCSPPSPAPLSLRFCNRQYLPLKCTPDAHFDLVGAGADAGAGRWS